MKKIIFVALAFALVALPVAAEIEDVPAAHLATAADQTLEDAAYRRAVAQNARELIALTAELGADFTGAPDSETMWRALSLYAARFAGDGQIFTDADLSALYGDLFAVGSFHDHDAAPMARFEETEGGYRFAAFESAGCHFACNDYDTYDDKALYLDVSAWSRDGASDTYMDTCTVRLVPDAQAHFGARVSGCERIADAPAFPDAAATAVLRDLDGNSYKPENVLDGKDDTCWAYTASEAEAPALTLTAEEPQTVRGAILTPGYAKSARVFSNNCRVKTLRVTLDNGNVHEFELSDLPADAYAGRFVLPFSALEDASALTFEILETYPGAHFDDVCVSEIQLF